MTSTSTYHSTINDPTVVSFDENDYNGMSELLYSTSSTSDYAITEADDAILEDVLENLNSDDADYNNNIDNKNSNNNNNNDDGMGDKNQYDYTISDDDDDDTNSLLNKFDNDDESVFLLSSDGNDNDTDIGSDNDDKQQRQVVMDMDMDITTNIEQEVNKNSNINININSSTNNTDMMSDDDVVIDYDQSDLDLMREDISEDFFDDHNNRSINNYENDASNYNRTDSTTSATTTNYHRSLSSSQVGTYDDIFDAAAPSQWLTGKLNSYKATSSLASYSSRSDDITSTTATTTSRKSNNNSNNKRNNFYANEDTKHKHWSAEEDENLKLEVHAFLQQQEGGRGNINSNNNANINWEHIALSKSFRRTRSIIQCKNRWCNHLQPGKNQGNWEQWEDELIRAEVKRLGFGHWAVIAKHELPHRIPNQIRDRWVEVLNTANTYKKKTPWSKTEDRILFGMQRTIGNKWVIIGKELPGRSPNDIKNRYHNKKTAQKKKEKKRMMFMTRLTPFDMGIEKKSERNFI